MEDKLYDLCVLGAGVSGLAAARFYLEVHPNAEVLVLERDGGVGGVWSKERVYPGFRSQSSVRLSGFSDKPFVPSAQTVDHMDLYDASCMSEYLDEYANDHSYAGKSLIERIKFSSTVEGLAQTATGWSIDYRHRGIPASCSASKVIVATGSTSVANMPEFHGKEAFGGPIVHTLNYGRSNTWQASDIKSIAVVGAGKSAADMVYQNVKLGRDVKWIIRKSGKGPGGFLSGELKAGDARNSAELAMTRWFSSLLVLPGLQTASWWQRFLYNTRPGAWLLTKFNNLILSRFTIEGKFDDRPGARESFKLLKTEFGLASPAGAIHHKDFWDVVAKNVDAYREDIDHLGEKTIHLKNGTTLHVDAILCGTGFKTSSSFFTDQQCVELGLPHPRAVEPRGVNETWNELDKEAESAVRQRFYQVVQPAPGPSDTRLGDIDPAQTPFRLYRCIAPTDPKFKHSIAFVGFATVVNMFANAEISAVWATAYLDGELNLPSEQDMKKMIAYTNCYMRLRNPTYGRRGNFFSYDYYPFIDGLLAEVGLSPYRRGSWWQEMTAPFLIRDLVGMKEEYLAKYHRRDDL